MENSLRENREPPGDVERIAGLIRGRTVTVLSGAGISTESGIPDYRGPTARVVKPITWQEFVASPAKRARYWARSSRGWPRLSGARPNAGHRALARLERAGIVRGIVTQNVDGLHQAAGSATVLELHGALAGVVCLDCGSRTSRAEIQDRIAELNPDWIHDASRLAPDGDAEVEPETASFRVPWCLGCGGVLKPDVVFFGESVPREKVERAFQIVDEGEVLLVTGSSLAVYSGFRFVERAWKQGHPIVIINIGPTRGDRLGTMILEAPLGAALSRLCSLLLD